MRYGTQKHLDYIKRRLQQTCRTKERVSVEYLSNKDLANLRYDLTGTKFDRKALGFTFNGASKIFIFINKNLEFETKAQTLVHEWAHAMTPIDVPAHGRQWAYNYYKAYQSIYVVD